MAYKIFVVLTQTQMSNMFEVQVWENVLEFGVVVRNLESKIQSIPIQLNLTLKCCICKFEKKRVDLTLFS